jgi:hypothetical protein
LGIVKLNGIVYNTMQGWMSLLRRAPLEARKNQKGSRPMIFTA